MSKSNTMAPRYEKSTGSGYFGREWQRGQKIKSVKYHCRSKKLYSRLEIEIISVGHRESEEFINIFWGLTKPSSLNGGAREGSMNYIIKKSTIRVLISIMWIWRKITCEIKPENFWGDSNQMPILPFPMWKTSSSLSWLHFVNLKF